MVLLCTQRALSTFASGMDQFIVIHDDFILLGFFSHLKLFPPRTKRLPVLPVLRLLPLFVPKVGKVHIAHPLEETVTDIIVRKMKVLPENIIRNSLAYKALKISKKFEGQSGMSIYEQRSIRSCSFGRDMEKRSLKVSECRSN